MAGRWRRSSARCVTGVAGHGGTSLAASLHGRCKLPRPLCRYCRICASRAWSAWTMSCAARDEVAAADPPRRASRPDELPSGASDSARWMLERHRYVWDRGNELTRSMSKATVFVRTWPAPDDGTDEDCCGRLPFSASPTHRSLSGSATPRRSSLPIHKGSSSTSSRRVADRRTDSPWWRRPICSSLA